MDIYVLDNELTRVRTVATSSECLSATEELELGKAGQLTLSLPISYKDTVKEMNILAIHDRDDRYRLYIVTNRNLNNYTLDIVAISYPNYALSRVGNVEDLRPKNRSLTELIPQILGNSGWSLNHVDENLPGYTGSFYYLSRLECLSQISEALACEFDFYVTISKNVITGQFVDVVEMLGEDTNKRFEYGTNALEVVAEYDATEVYTQAVGRGKGEETGDGYGRRIEFTDVVWSKANGDPVDKPAGQNWVNDPYENYQLPGNKRPQKIIEFEEITDPEILLEETYKWLLDNNHPKVQFKAKIVETGALNLGDRVQIIRPDLDIRYKTRVFKLTRNLLNENLTEVEFGDNIATTPMDKLNSIATQVDSTNQAINRVEQQVTMIDANGVRVNYGPNDPTVKKKGDIWYKENSDGSTSLLRWNGEEWERVVDEGIIADIEKNVEDAMSDAAQAKTDANTARNDASDAIDKATQVERDFNTELGNLNLELSSVKAQANTALSNSENAILNASKAQTSVDILNDKVNIFSSNINNLFPNGNFSDTSMKEFDLISGSYTTQGVFNSPQSSFSELGVAYPTQNTNKNCCVINNGIDLLKVKKDYSFNVNSGEEFYIQFDFYNDTSALIEVGILFDNNSKLYVRQNATGLRNWHRIKGKVKAPNGAVSGVGYISMSASVKAYCFVSNVSISRVDASSSLIEVQNGKITEAVRQAEALNVRVQTAEGTIESISNLTGSNTLVNTVKGMQQKIADNEGNIQTVTKTANTALTNIQNLEQKTDTKFLQTDTLLAMQSQKIGAYYPNGDFSDKTYSKWYTGNGSIESDSSLFVDTDGTSKGFAFLSEYIPVEGDKPMYLSFKGAYSPRAVKDNCFIYVHEYDANKTETRNGSDLVFKNNEPVSQWSNIEKTWNFGTNPKYIRIEWVVFPDAGRGDMSIKNITLKNGTESLTGQISVLNDNINLSVKKGDVINQINVSTEGILIDGKKIHITGQTSIDNAVIKDAMIANLSASKLTAGTIDASKINVINLNAANITGVNTKFIQSSWNGINSNIKIDSSGLKINKSNGENLLLSNGSLQWRDRNNKEIFGISRFTDGNINLAVGTGEKMSIMYDGSVDDNNYYSAMSFNGTTGDVTFDSSGVFFQDRKLLFTTMDWGNGRVASIREATSNKTGIGFGAGQLYLGDAKGILSVDDIRKGKLNGLTHDDRYIYFKNNNFGTGSVFCLSGRGNAVNIGFGDQTLWLGDSEGAVTLDRILRACGLR